MLLLRKNMNTEYCLPLSKFSTYWHAAYFFIWYQVFPYFCHRQCKQCISSFICSQLQFSSDPTDQPSFLLLPFSCRAASPTFLFPTSFLLWKQSKTERCTYLFNLLLMLDFTAYLGEAIWKAPRSAEWSMVCKVFAVLRLCWEGVQNWFQLFPPFPARSFHQKWAAWSKTLKRSKQCNVVGGSTSGAECPPCSAILST